ncbi:MAG: hypothetical protein ACQSGP_13365 [Frankia sp.]
MPVLASSRAGNLVRAVLAILVITLIFREIYLLWFFHTAAWTSRPAQIKYCGGWYDRDSGIGEQTRGEAESLAGGSLKRVWTSPVNKPIVAHKPSSACPRWVFAKVGGNTYVAYQISD